MPSDGDVIYANGWEVGDPTKEAGSLTTTGGTATATATNKQTGDYCLRLNRTSAAALTFAQYVNSTPEGNAVWPAGIRQVAGSFSLYVASLPSSATDTPLFYFTHFSGNDATLTLNSSGQLKLQVVGQSISSTIATLSAGNRYLIEVKDDTASTGHKLYCRVNGGTEVSSTSGSEGANDVSGFDLGQYGTASNTWDLYIDDVVFVQGTTYPVTLFGIDPRVLPVYPDAGAANLDTTWAITAGGGTSRAAVIDESPPDDATSYITGSSSGAVQRIPMTDTTVPGTPLAVNLRIRSGSNSATGTRLFTANIRDGSAGSDGASSTLSYDVNGWIKVHHTTPLMDVPGGSGWTQTDIDNLVARLVKDANTNQVRVTWLIAQVVYAPSTSVSETPLTGGAVGAGVAPTARVTAIAGGAVGAGSAPSARATAITGGAVGGGSAPVARVTATTGGAVGGGVSPTNRASGVTTPAGALGGGVAPAVRVTGTSSGATGGGAAPGSSAAVAQGGAVAGGVAPTERLSESPTPGGAVGSGVAPTGVVSSAPAGGAVAAGNGPAARVDTTTGGAIADGNVVTEAGEDVADRGGALAAGRDLAGARADVGQVGALAGGFPPEPRESDTPLVGGAVGGGTPPSGSATLDPAGVVGSGRAPAVTAPAPIGGALGQGTGAIEVPVTNGSLDSWSAGVPVGWSLSLGSASIAEETSDVHAGSAARITYTSGSTQMFQNVTAVPGALRFAVWHKESATGRTLALSPLVVGGPSNGLRLQPDGSWSSAFSLRSLPNSLAWTQHGIDFVLPAGATGVRLTMWAQGGAATFLVDDVTLDALPRAVTSIEPGGAVAGGIAPSDGFTSGDTADVGGAVAGGVGPAARVDVAAGGALGGGNAPDVGGTSETPDRGGAIGAGREPAPRVTATITGALGAGRSSSPRVTVGTAGANAGGTSPGEGESQVAGRGGATGAGVAPSAWASAATGGAAAGGRAPTARFGAVSPGGALGGGLTDSGALVPVDVGGGVAGGRPITEPDGGLHVAGGGVPRMGLGTMEVV